MYSRTLREGIHPVRTAITLKAEQKKTEGCIVCGQDLVYLKEKEEETCLICGLSFPTHARCMKGHYVCDSCHSKDTLERVEALLINSLDVDPVRLACKIFEIPGLNMHGPEYHSIVPAILITACQNVNGQRNISAIREAIERGRSTRGGSCGLHGNCGAGVGAGIAVSILEQASPLSSSERSAANRATALALLAISENAGPRCCKRDAVATIESFTESTAYFTDKTYDSYNCRQFSANKTCMGKACPYHPAAQHKTKQNLREIQIHE